MLPDAGALAATTGGHVRLVGHQANLTMLRSVARRVEIDADAHWHNVADFANSCAAGAPTVLSQHWEDLAAGDVILLVVVGSSLSWASSRLEIDG
jgi:3-oxoacyl-[acyl-carrier-protein] synthase-3